MEISSASLHAREATLSRAYVGRDQPQRAAEDHDEAEKTRQEETVTEVKKVESARQGRIDMYA